MYVTLPNGRKIRMPTDEEDAAIRAGIKADPDARELDDEWFAGARPAREVLSPALYAKLTDKSKPAVFRHVTDAKYQAQLEVKRRVGRPKLETPKKRIAIRLDDAVLSAFRATGKGWQTRMNALLLEAVEQGRVRPAKTASS